MASDATKSKFLGHAWLRICPKLVSDAVFEERATENDGKAGTEPYPRGSKNMRKRVVFTTCLIKKEKHNACWMEQKRKKHAKTLCFRWVFEERTPRKSSQSRLDPHVGSGNAQKWDLDAKKHAPGSSPNSKIVRKRVVSAMFYKKRIKASYNGCEKLKVRGEAEEMRKTCENALFWTLF